MWIELLSIDNLFSSKLLFNGALTLVNDTLIELNDSIENFKFIEIYVGDNGQDSSAFLFSTMSLKIKNKLSFMVPETNDATSTNKLIEIFGLQLINNKQLKCYYFTSVISSGSAAGIYKVIGHN